MSGHVWGSSWGKLSGKSHFEYQSYEDFDFDYQKHKESHSYLMIFCLNYIVTFWFSGPVPWAPGGKCFAPYNIEEMLGKGCEMSGHVWGSSWGKLSGKSHFQYQSYEDFDSDYQKHKEAHSYLMIFRFNYIVTLIFRPRVMGTWGKVLRSMWYRKILGNSCEMSRHV